MTHALHSSERHDWQTPEWFLDLVRAVEPIALDPATTMHNPTKARVFYSPDMGRCGLRGNWARGSTDLAFINPPYGAHLDGPIDPHREIWRRDKITGQKVLVGVGTGWAARIAADPGSWIALVPNRTETEWFRTLYDAAHLVAFPARRIAFVDAQTGEVGKSPNHGSAVFMHGHSAQCERFLCVFGVCGIVVKGAVP